MTVLAVLSLLLLAYTIAGYPLLQTAVARFRPRPVDAADPTDTDAPVSVVICARDEGPRIQTRIANLLAMDYPAERLEVIVVSDGSVDGTDEAVLGYGDPRVRLIRQDRPMGKAAALNAGVAAASHDLLLMGDARQTFAPDVARLLLSHFHDPTVGAVSGRLEIRPEHGSGAASGVGASYWSLEVRLRAAESAGGSVIGVTGAIYALRKVCFAPLPEGTVLDDVLIPMRAALKGYRVLYDTRAVAVDAKPVSDAGESARKVRTLYGNLQLLRLAPELFLPWKNPLWFRFVSHKILRLFLPLFFGGALIFSLAAGGWLSWFGVLQAVGWLAAWYAWKTKNNSRPGRVLSALLLLNLAVIRAWVRFLRNDDQVWSAASSNHPGDREG
ncbi:glycosyl transferase family 2 [Pseudodesulfovibrio mercurii]|uniref:Glycosyl transferase family 2 n=1 Tax=Pseudodesulfovibrio mercurii TaxID=641491 RepID=F0JC99_9BACT|nr:glycosyltransferase family 2 protein [Pseudodesulfovibrio mercurii]EGB14397.1 glycosyl transferase family 2 [Pseudodesulfovibrio mercurii]